MSRENHSKRRQNGDTFPRRRFLKYGSTVAGAGLGAAPAVADDGEETEPVAEMGVPSEEVEGTSTPTYAPDDEISQTWYFTISCPGFFCPPGPFSVVGVTMVEHAETGQVITFDAKSWSQGYETVERTWDLGTPTEWADQLGLESPEGQWNINGEMYVDGVLSDVASIPILVEEECALRPQIRAKRDSISAIRADAGQFGMPPETVDQQAEALLDDVIADEDDCADTDDEEELEQFEEAIERMLAAEEVTERATVAATEPGGPIERIAELILEVAIKKATDYIKRKVDGMVRRFVNGVVNRLLEAADNVLDSYAGRGVINRNVFNEIQRYLNALSSASYFAIEAIDDGSHESFDPDDDPWDTIVDTAYDDGATAAKWAGDQLGITGAIEDAIGGEIPDPQAFLEEILFTGYYDSPWVPELHVPAPSELEIPDINVHINLPTEYLPGWLVDPDIPVLDPPSIPDEININVGTPDIPLPEVPVFTDVHEIRTSLGRDPGLPTGVNNSINARMHALESSLGTLDEQSAGSRNHVRSVFAGGIDAVNEVTNTIHAIGDWIGGVIGWFEDQASNVATGMLLSAGLLFITIKGIPLAIKAAAVAVKAAVLSAKLSAIQLKLDTFQAAVGAGASLYYANLHHVAATGIIEDDLGGVSHG